MSNVVFDSVGSGGDFLAIFRHSVFELNAGMILPHFNVQHVMQP
jgi:hypothetical protein